MPFLTSGSPPVSLYFTTPRLLKTSISFINSSIERTSCFGRNFISSTMQYVHLKSHLSVTETLKYSIFL